MHKIVEDQEICVWLIFGLGLSEVHKFLLWPTANNEMCAEHFTKCCVGIVVQNVQDTLLRKCCFDRDVTMRYIDRRGVVFGLFERSIKQKCERYISK